MESKQNAVMAAMIKLPEALSKMGFDKMREGQDKVVCSLVAMQDTICILPTATGKTACYVLPTLAHGWKTLVISPLLALMRDQVQGLHRKGIAAGQLSGLQTDALNTKIMNDWRAGRLSFLYIAPERLETDGMMDLLKAMPPDFVVVDEAHTASQWHYNFRPSYARVGDLVKEIRPKVVAAFTATCTDKVEDDIREIFNMQHANKVVHYPPRENLHIFVRNRRLIGKRRDEKEVTVDNILGELNAIIDYANNEVKGSALVYCSSRSGVEETCIELQSRLWDGAVDYYHGAMTPAEKAATLDSFLSGRTPIMVCTNAFGMGVDKPDIRMVIHKDIPGSIEALAQEVGRAGRDGKDSDCILFLTEDGIRTQMYFIQSGHPTYKHICKVYEVIRKACDPYSGIARITVADIAEAMMEDNNEMLVSSAITILKSYNVIQRLTKEEIEELGKKCSLYVNGECKPIPPRNIWLKYWKAIQETGMPIDDADKEAYACDLILLAEHMGCKEASVRSNINKAVEAGYVKWLEKPKRGGAIRLLSDMSCVPQEECDIKREQAEDALAKVVDFCMRIPDKDRQEWLRNYFM